MPNPLRDFFFGTIAPKRDLVEAITPRRSFNDVILPASTRRALDYAMAQIKKRDLIYGQWGLGERHATGLGLAFNFAGPPGTGKTICAEAIAQALGKKLLVVRYSEMESLWAGETGKNVSSVFAAAREQDAVLFFDEADAIAGRRFTSITQGYQREANTVVNVLLKELESFDGVVIFATNLAANFDPAFERRVRTHILFELPGAKEREQIWKVQLHARKTPLAPDVDFAALAQKYEVAGGEIKNAVLKAAQMATAEPGADAEKKIHQRHFEAAMTEVMGAKKVMEQSLFEDGDGSHAMTAMAGLNGAYSQMSRNQEAVQTDVRTLSERVGEIERNAAALPGIVERFDDAARASQLQMRAELIERLDALADQILKANNGAASELAAIKKELPALTSRLEAAEAGHAEVPKLAERIDQLATDWGGKAAETNTKIAAFETGRTELRDQLTAVTGQITAMTEQVGALAKRIETSQETAIVAQREIETRDKAAEARQLELHARQNEMTEWQKAMEARWRTFLPIALTTAGLALLVAAGALIHVLR